MIAGIDDRKVRERFRLAPEQLAEDIGVSVSDLAEIEAGKRGVDAYQIIQMCLLFARPIPYSFEWEEDPGSLTANNGHNMPEYISGGSRLGDSLCAVIEQSDDDAEFKATVLMQMAACACRMAGKALPDAKYLVEHFAGIDAEVEKVRRRRIN